MRRDLLHIGAANLKYEIREIVVAAHELERLGLELTWENIGDPVQKGEVPSAVDPRHDFGPRE